MTLDIKQKVIGVPLQKGIQEKDDGTIIVLGRFTSDSRDEVGDIITRSATERALPKYKQWGNIRYMHQPMPVGKVSKIGTGDGLEWNEVEINVIDPKAVFEVKMGLLQALSVGILVNWEDVEMLADGGWVINDYSLAEISLVDHPANYDARLMSLGLGLDEAARNKARQEGLIPTLKGLGISIPGDEKMTEENKDLVAAEVTPAVDNATTTEAVEADKSIDVAAAAPVEEPVVEETPATEKSVEVTETPAETEPVVVEESAPVETPVDAITLETLDAAIKSLTAKLETVVAQKALSAQAPSAVEQPKGEANDELAKAKSQIAELEAKVLELSTPVDRTAALPTEDVTPAVEGETAAEPEAMPKDLRGAVRKFVETTTRK